MISRKKRLKMFFYNFIFFIINRDFYIIRSSSLTLEERNLIAIVNCIFHVSDLFRSSMISFKYDLILLRYSSNDSFYFYHHYFHIKYNSCFKSCPFLLVCNCLLFLAYKCCWYLLLFCLFFYSFIFLLKSKKISYILNCGVSFFFFYLILFSSRLGLIEILSNFWLKLP